MLWYKSWLETRWRFIIGLAILICSAGGMVLAYPQLIKLVPAAETIDASGEIGRRIREGVELARDYRGYVWSQWFRQSLPQLWTLFAVLLGTGGLPSRESEGAELFTLSMPASRNRLLQVRAGVGLSELAVMAFVPSLLLPLLSPAVGQSYSIADALIHSACLFVAGVVFFSLAFLLSTSFSDLWRPLLIACSVAVVIVVIEYVFRDFRPYSIYRVMDAEVFFRRRQLPWIGLLASAGLSFAMFYAAARNIARRDF